MFRRVRELAQRGRRRAKSLLARVGRAVKRTGLWLGAGTLAVGKVLALGVQALARGISWTWMSVVEVYSLSEAPFIWILGNIGFWLFRVGETVTNKIRKTQYTWAHRNFPAFSLLNAWSLTNIALYPLVALVGWILSPLTNQDWWRTTAHGYKVRTVSLADFPYVDRARRDLAFDKTMRPEPDYSQDQSMRIRIEQQNEEQRQAGADLTADRYRAGGYAKVYPDPSFLDDPPMRFRYLIERLESMGGDVELFELTIHEDVFGRWWALIDTHGQMFDVSPPEPMGEEVDPTTDADVDDVDEHGLLNFPVAEHVDYTKISDPKERSYYFGVEWFRNSVKTIPEFLASTESQDKARALVFRESRNPQTGLLSSYAIKGFNQALDEALQHMQGV